MKVSNGYTRIQIGIHWLTVLLIAAAWITGDGMGRVLRTRIQTGETGLAGGTLHSNIGLIIFGLILIRIIVRLISGAPAVVKGTSDLMEKAAKLGHWALYILMVVVPLLGVVSWFGHIRFLGEVHSAVSNALFAVAGGHGAFALYHHFIVRDETLRRMLKPAK